MPIRQRIFAEEDHSFQAAFLNRLHESLRVCIQIWGSRRQFDRFDSYISKHAQEFPCEQRVPIMNEITLTFEESRLVKNLKRIERVWFPVS